jgi:UDP-glucose 6-dehydrogenase
MKPRFSFNQKTVALLGLSFKKRTNDMRDSAALRVVESLLSRGVRAIQAYDPLAIDEAKRNWFNLIKITFLNGSATMKRPKRQSPARMRSISQPIGRSFAG